MARTLQQLLTTARGHIQDETAPYRTSDETLLGYLNDSIYEIRRLRPDAFSGMFAVNVPQFTTSDLADSFPLDGQFYTAVSYFIAGNAELKDDQHVNESRAMGFLALFTAKLTKAGA